MNPEEQALVEKIEANRFLTATDRQFLLDRWREATAQLQEREHILAQLQQNLSDKDAQIKHLAEAAQQSTQAQATYEQHLQTQQQALDAIHEQLQQTQTTLQAREQYIAQQAEFIRTQTAKVSTVTTRISQPTARSS